MRYPEFLRAGRVRVVAALLLALLITVTVGARAEAAPQGPWVLPADDLSQTGEHSYDTRVAVDGDGTATAVWSRDSGSSEVIQSSSRPPGGTWGPVENLSSAIAESGDPQVAAGADGTVTVVWLQEQGSHDEVMTSTFPPGAGFGPVERLSTLGQNARAPRVAIGDDGTATAIWTEDTGSNYLVRTSTRPPGGGFAAAQFISAAGQDARDPEVAVGPQGTTTTIWRRDNGSGQFIVQTRTKPDGGAYGLIQSLSAAGQTASRPGLAVGGDGSIVAIWARSNGANFIVQTRSRPSGGIFGPTEDLSAPGQDGSDPRVTIGSDGTTAAVWFRSAGPDDVLQARIRPPNGAFGPVEDVTGTLVIAGDLGLASAPDGTDSVIWYSKIGPDYVVQAATRHPGMGFGPTEVLSAPGANTSYPDIAIGPDGVATAVWTRYDGSRDIAQAASTLSASVLTVTKQGSGQGTVTSAPGGIDCGPVCAGLFSFYAPVTLTATPATGSRFTGWSGDCSGQATTCRLDPSEARTTTAGFCPPKTLRPGKLKRNKKKGTARLAVTAGGVGKVVLRKSKQVRKSSKEVGSNGRGRLRVKVRGRKAKKLRRNGRVRVRIRLIYKPGDDCPDKTATRKVKLVRK